jgi:hypothetical protein
MTGTVVAIFAIVYVGMILCALPLMQLDRQHHRRRRSAPPRHRDRLARPGAHRRAGDGRDARDHRRLVRVVRRRGPGMIAA